MKSTIQEVESRLEEGLAKLRSPEYKSLESLLQPLVPEGFRVHVSLVDKKGRKKRKDASADKWSPELGEVRINFEPETKFLPAVQQRQSVSGTRSKDSAAAPDPLTYLVQALDRAEARPGYDFVALKWFRDVVLPAEGLDWAQSESMRQNVLREAIEKRLVLTSKVPNPKSPQFPVTAIRLNRLLPETLAKLGTGTVSNSEFDPVEIRGESLSATVLRERR